MRKLFLFGAMLVMALFAKAQVENYISYEKEHPVLALRDGKIGWVSSEDETKVLIPFEYDGVFINTYTRIGLVAYEESVVKELVTANESCGGFEGSFPNVYYKSAYNLYEEHKDYYDELGIEKEYEYGRIVTCLEFEERFTVGSWIAFPVFVMRNGKLGAIDSVGNINPKTKCTKKWDNLYLF